ncbi:hypothetical protein [Natrinema sp. CBA1119]|uniref:hypothetical protein n=1 Tax=Natrinema sp. CBA1119 TaxID=1608465 RepID=UPI0011457238|nr:hypothetical protein [Natrinema sp. CBA1119]
MNGGDKGRHAEQAIVEYLPPTYRPDRFRDDLDELEADLRTDLDQAGLLDVCSSSKQNPAVSRSDETVKVTYRIADDVQNALEQYVYDQEKKVRSVSGDYIATAFDEYRDGGQVARVRRYYEQLRDGTDIVSEDRVGQVIDQLNNNLDYPEYCHIKGIRVAVDEALDVHSDDIRDDFADRVIDRLGFVAVETSDGVYATPERAKQLAQENKTDDDLDWYEMDKKDRVEHLVAALKARANGSSSAGVDYNQVRDQIFDRHPSNDYCYELMSLADEYPGFEYGEHNGKLRLRYNRESDPAEIDDDWVDRAVELIEEFCKETGLPPNDVEQPILDNRIVQARFPTEYDEVEGPNDQAIENVTEEDRIRVRVAIDDSGSNE